MALFNVSLSPFELVISASIIAILIALVFLFIIDISNRKMIKKIMSGENVKKNLSGTLNKISEIHRIMNDVIGYSRETNRMVKNNNGSSSYQSRNRYQNNGYRNNRNGYNNDGNKSFLKSNIAKQRKDESGQSFYEKPESTPGFQAIKQLNVVTKEPEKLEPTVESEVDFEKNEPISSIVESDQFDECVNKLHSIGLAVRLAIITKKSSINITNENSPYKDYIEIFVDFIDRLYYYKDDADLTINNFYNKFINNEFVDSITGRVDDEIKFVYDIINEINELDSFVKSSIGLNKYNAVNDTSTIIDKLYVELTSDDVEEAPKEESNV